MKSNGLGTNGSDWATNSYGVNGTIRSENKALFIENGTIRSENEALLSRTERFKMENKRFGPRTECFGPSWDSISNSAFRTFLALISYGDIVIKTEKETTG